MSDYAQSFCFWQIKQEYWNNYNEKLESSASQLISCYICSKELSKAL
jgi:hypothetical protein